MGHSASDIKHYPYGSVQGTYVEKYIQWVYKLQRCRRQYGCIFIRLGLAASQICEIPRNSPKIRTESSSRSYKVTDHGVKNVNRKRIIRLPMLLVINSKFGRRPISYYFRDIDV